MLITAALAGALLSAGCAQAEPENTVTSTPPPTGPSSTPSSLPQPSPSAPATPDKGEVTLTGTVEVTGIEGGCTVLRVDTGKAYEIKGGDTTVLTEGARVKVRGKIRTDLMTICQIGPVLEVISAEPE